MKYPITKKVDQKDNYFGTEITDPYRWLEDDHGADTIEWVKEQKNFTENYISNLPMRDKIYERLEKLSNYPKFTSPFKAGQYYYYYYNSGLQNQSVIYRQKSLDSKGEIFLDPNTLSEKGTTSAVICSFSPDYKYVTILIKHAGSDWATIKVIDTKTLKWLDDEIKWVKISQTSWLDNGFYYSGYEKPLEKKELSGQNKFHKNYFHKLGTKQEDDQLIYEDIDNPLRYHIAFLTQDKRFLILNISEGTDGNEVRIMDLTKNKKEFKVIFPGFKNKFWVEDNLNDKILAITNYNAPNYRVVLLDPQNPSPENWIDFLPEKTFLLESFNICGSKIFAFYLKDCCSFVEQWNLNGDFEKVIELPGKGRAWGLSGKRDHKEGFFTFSSFTFPNEIYHYDFEKEKISLFKRSQIDFDIEKFETKQVFFTSKDSTKIPMFLVNKKNIPIDKKRPVLLYGYGGFNHNLTPFFNYSIIPFLEKGGVYASVNLRGGGEYGEKWHKAGMKLNKQNVFDDFISAAEYLIDEGYTNKEKIAISGGSNGGLLVGACMVQRPDLFKVALPAVGVLDMLRFHKFTIGWGWVGDYGSSDNEEEFKYLLKYSPLHNLKKDVKYPATLITTADHDDRVVPAHSFKFAAELQEKGLKTENPYLIRIDIDAGHGGSSLTKFLNQRADILSFIMYHLKIED